MITRASNFVILLLIVAAGVVVGASRAALAETAIVEPSQVPYEVAVDGAGEPEPFTVKVSGFEPGAVVYVMQCDGSKPNEANWKPTLDCDPVSSPAGAIVAADGTAVFDRNDRNHAFHPFQGPSPEVLFNCLADGQESPGNGALDDHRCQVRVATSNVESTADQVFLPLRFLEVPAADTSSDDDLSATPWIVVAAAMALAAVVAVLVRSRRRRVVRV